PPPRHRPQRGRREHDGADRGGVPPARAAPPHLGRPPPPDGAPRGPPRRGYRVGPAAGEGGSGAPVQHWAVSPGDPSARGNRWSERAGLMGDSLRSELEVPLVEASQQPVVEVETPHAVCDLLQAQVLV